MLFPFTGNCKIIAIIRISLFERLTNGRFRNHISFVSQAKNINGKQQICHYGIRTRNMSPPERYTGGNFQKATYEPFKYLQTMSNTSNFAKMYDVLSANSIFRAKQRAKRNQTYNSRVQVLEAFSMQIKEHMNTETSKLHNHVLQNSTPLSRNISLNI
jgi:hypothetical protein